METKNLWKKLIQLSKENIDFYNILKRCTLLEANEHEVHIELNVLEIINLDILFGYNFNHFIKNYWKEQTNKDIRIFFYQKKLLVNFGNSESTYSTLERFLKQTDLHYTPESIRIYSNMFYALYCIFEHKLATRDLIEIYFDYYTTYEENKKILSFKLIFSELKKDFRLKPLFINDLLILAFVIYNSIYIQRVNLENPTWLDGNLDEPTNVLNQYNLVKNVPPYKVFTEKNLDNNNRNLQRTLNEFNSLIGLENVKEYLNSFINLVKMRKMRQEKCLPEIPLSFHMLFSGNPGTGKTTVARYLAKIYKELGVLKKGHLVEVDRSDLIGRYIGETEEKTKAIIEKSLDGVLFIDEAYALTSTHAENDYGKEAINLLVKAMEDYRERLIVIVAGYPKLMDDFINSNPGLKSRFNNQIVFQTYLPSELWEIFEKFCYDYELFIDTSTKETIQNIFEKMYLNADKNFGNARAVRNFFDKIQLIQANRLAKIDADISINDLSFITNDDVKKAALDLSLSC